MFYIKKLVVHGFKSFVRKTEIPFTPAINVILGPNGSGKSNISDALCFVLGRLSTKSMRAHKTKNLIFMGTKTASASKEASVELIFDNSSRVFSIDKDEISLKRIIKKNSKSIYKINNETKTRHEVLTLLAQVGIDPYGFNIILQGEIQNFVRMHTDDRRKVIEEVSGISIYELRKQKSLRELEKIDVKLKEVLTILRERTIYLHNLERERQQALRFKKLEKDSKKCKASLIYQSLTKNKKEKEKINFEIAKKNEEINKIKKITQNIEISTNNFESKSTSINLTIQKSTGLEQEKLNREIANMRADLAGMNVNFENYKNKLSQILNQKQETQKIISDNKISIKKLQKETPDISQKEEEIEFKKQELEKLEKQRKQFYTIKSELKSIKERFHEKKSLLQTLVDESEFLIKQIESLYIELFDKKTDTNKLNTLKISLKQKQEILEKLSRREIDLEKVSYANEAEIDRHKKLIAHIAKMDICPICRNKITKEHIDSINIEIPAKINFLKQGIKKSDKELSEISKNKRILKQDIEQITSEISKRESDLIKISNINEKQIQIKNLHQKVGDAKQELAELEKKQNSLEKNFREDSNIEQKYETVRIEVQEISLRNKKNISSEISFKEREFERSKISLKQFLREEEDLNEEIIEASKYIKQKEAILERKKQQERELSKRFHKLISEKEILENKIRENQSKLLTEQNTIHNIEQAINELKIERARIDAKIQNLETELQEFKNIEIIKVSEEVLMKRLNKIEEILSRIGSSVNLRSLEVYDSVKKEYDLIKEKTEIISKEKEGIFKIISQIDIKKKKAFLKTLYEINDIFSENFAKLNTKGKVSLQLENKKYPFAGGVNILVKTGHGKYFDVKSLSGGEQTLVALSLIFAIQELKPYPFYILDEIDAALDKKNSERLAGLLKKYMEKGQYIVITHNDEIITGATTLYGVSMHDGISKVISLEV